MSEIQEAIEFYKSQNENMERETWNPEKVCPAYEKNKLAIAALQDQAKHEKGCELCNGEMLDRVEISKHFGEMRIALLSGGHPSEESKFKFCPNCGRDLRKSVSK